MKGHDWMKYLQTTACKSRNWKYFIQMGSEEKVTHLFFIDQEVSMRSARLAVLFLIPNGPLKYFFQKSRNDIGILTAYNATW